MNIDLILSKSQGYGQIINKVTNEILHECRMTHVLWVICDVEFDGSIPFLSLASGNVNVRSN